jgi:hypothetical protein
VPDDGDVANLPRLDCHALAPPGDAVCAAHPSL